MDFNLLAMFLSKKFTVYAAILFTVRRGGNLPPESANADIVSQDTI